MIKKKIKVLRIINRFNIGGPTYNATFLTAFLSEKFETLLIGGAPDKQESDSLHILKKYNVEPLIIPELKRNPNLFSDRKALKKIKSIIKEFKPDIVHTHASKAGAIGRQAAFICGIPVVIHTFHGHVFHSYFGKLKTWIFKKIEQRLAQKSSAIIAISKTQKYELTHVHGICQLEKVHVIPLGFDLEEFKLNRENKRNITREKLNIDQDTIEIAIIGRLAEIKNHAFFIDAAKLVKAKSQKKLKFFIVGDGEERETLKTYYFEKAPECDIIFTSWIKDIASFNCGMDIICLCSKNEGTPVSLIEAQACNIPIVSTSVGGIEDVVENNVTGLLSKPNDLEEFVNNLFKLIENENFRLKMSQNGWNFVKDKFGYSRLVTDVEKLYEKLLKKSLN